MMITTRNLKSPATVEPQKLNIITTAIIPNATPQPAPVGDGFAKMITTHDDPKKFDAAAVIDKLTIDMGRDKVDVEVGKPIDVAPPKVAAPKPRKPRKAKKG
jgi:hypothetical protein